MRHEPHILDNVHSNEEPWLTSWKEKPNIGSNSYVCSAQYQIVRCDVLVRPFNAILVEYIFIFVDFGCIDGWCVCLCLYRYKNVCSSIVWMQTLFHSSNFLCLLGGRSLCRSFSDSHQFNMDTYCVRHADATHQAIDQIEYTRLAKVKRRKQRQ